MTAPIGPSELYARGMATLVATWEAYARGSQGAAVHRDGGATSAVFPREPERSILNNAVLDRHLPRAERAAAVEAMEHAYAEGTDLAAKRGVMPGQVSDGGTLGRMDEIEHRIAALEALNEVNAEMSSEVQEASIDAQLEALGGGDTALDDELEALKARMKAQQSLPPSGGTNE